MLTGGSPEIDAFNQAFKEYAPDLELSGATASAWESGELLRKAATNIQAEPTSEHEQYEGGHHGSDRCGSCASVPKVRGHRAGRWRLSRCR